MKELSWVSFIKALIPVTRTLPSGPDHLPKAPPSNTMLGIRFQHRNSWGRSTNIQSIVVPLLKNHLTTNAKDHLWALNSILLLYMLILMPVPHCPDAVSQTSF